MKSHWNGALLFAAKQAFFIGKLQWVENIKLIDVRNSGDI
jgi:hypothetical protein